MSKSLIRQLKKLENISPDSSWRASERDLLLSKIDNRNILNVASNGGWNNFYFSHLTFVAVRPAMALILMIALVLSGSIATVSAAKGSLPGDTLYPVKLAGEQVRLAFAPGEVEKAKVQLDIVESRVNEITELVNNKESGGGKSEEIKKTVENFKISMSAIKDHINKASAEGSTQELVNLAQEVSEKTKQYESALNESHAQLQEQDIANEVALNKEENNEDTEASVKDAVDMVNFTSTDALKVLIYQENTEKVKINQDQIKERVYNEISNYQDKFNQAAGQYEKLKEVYNNSLELIVYLQNLEPTEEVRAALTEEELASVGNLSTKLKDTAVDLKDVDLRLKESGQLIVDRLNALYERGKFKNFIDDLFVYRDNLLNIENYIKETNDSLELAYKELEDVKNNLIIVKEEDQQTEENITDESSEILEENSEEKTEDSENIIEDNIEN